MLIRISGKKSRFLRVKCMAKLRIPYENKYLCARKSVRPLEKSFEDKKIVIEAHCLRFYCVDTKIAEVSAATRWFNWRFGWPESNNVVRKLKHKWLMLDWHHAKVDASQTEYFVWMSGKPKPEFVYFSKIFRDLSQHKFRIDFTIIWGLRFYGNMREAKLIKVNETLGIQINLLIAPKNTITPLMRSNFHVLSRQKVCFFTSFRFQCVTCQRFLNNSS